MTFRPRVLRPRYWMLLGLLLGALAPPPGFSEDCGTCGDGIVDMGEQCDDGNQIEDDGCSSTCEASARRAGCGDGTIGQDETCDDGNRVDGDGCDTNCTATGCPNGIVTTGEGCDDGNQTNGDGCSALCQFETGNAAPDCSAATVDPDQIQPPNGDFVPLSIAGVTEPDGDATTITIISVAQDEPVTGSPAGAFTRVAQGRDDDDDEGDDDGDDDRDGDDDDGDDDGDDDDDDGDDDDGGTGGGGQTSCPDAAGVGTTTASVRAERDDNGDGRVYHITFRADDGRGGQCTGTVTVCVPQVMGAGAACVDQGPNVDSTPVDCAAAPQVALCQGEDIPEGVKRRLDKAHAMLESASHRQNLRRARKLAKKSMILLGRANRAARGALRRGTISAECAADLRDRLDQARTQAVNQFRSMRGR